MSDLNLDRTEDYLRALSEAFEEHTGEQGYLYCSRPTPGTVRYVFGDRVCLSLREAEATLEQRLDAFDIPRPTPPHPAPRCERPMYGGAELCENRRPCPIHDPKPFEEP